MENFISSSRTTSSTSLDGTTTLSSTSQSSETASESPKRKTSFLDDPERQKLSQDFRKATEEWVADMEEWWRNLPTDQQQWAFYNVCRRIYEGDVMQRRSYRGVLYDTFGWGPEAYALGMEARYMDLHNLLWDAIEGDTKYSDRDLKRINQELEDAAKYDCCQD